MSQKIFFFDIDGTLFDNEQRSIKPSAIKTLRELKRRGHKVAICTSRCLEETIHLPDHIVDEMDIIVTGGGAKAIDKHGVIFEKIINQKIVEEVIQFNNKHGIIMRWSTDENTGYFCEHTSEEIDDRFYRLYQMIPTKKEYTNEKVINILCYPPTSLEADIIQISKDCHITHMNEVIEITAPNVNKATGIANVMKHFSLTMQDAIAFGDGNNDVEMLSEVGLGIAMGNASDSVKQYADMVCKRVDEDAIYEMCLELGYI